MPIRETKFITAGTNSGNTGYTGIAGGNNFGVASNTSGGPNQTNTGSLYQASIIASLYHTGSHLVLEIGDANENVVNAGWDKIVVDGTTFNRTAATYTEDYSTYLSYKIDRWQWNNVSSPFTNGQEEQVTWETNAAATTATALSQTISNAVWKENFRVSDTRELLTTDTLAWTTEVTTAHYGQQQQMNFASTSGSTFFNCTLLSGTIGNNNTITIMPIQKGPYYALVSFSHNTSSSDTNVSMSEVRKQFLVWGSVRASGDINIPYSKQPPPEQMVTFTSHSNQTKTKAVGLDGTNNRILVRYGPDTAGTNQSPLGTHSIAFTNTNCQTWNAALTSQITSVQEATNFYVIPTTAGTTYTCSGALSVGGTLTATMVLTGRCNSNTPPHEDFGVQIFKAFEPRYPRLDTSDKQGFENTYHTGTLTKGSSTTISVPGITLGGQDWGIESDPFNEHYKVENPSTGSIKITRLSTDPSTTTNREFTLKTFKLTS